MKRHEVLTKELTACLFAEMQYVGNRGPKFSWEAFPSMAASLVKTQLFLYCPDNMPKWAPEKAADVARDYAKHLVNLMQGKE